MTVIRGIISYVGIALLLFGFWLKTEKTSILFAGTDAEDLVFEAMFWPLFLTIRFLAILFRWVEREVKKR